MPPVVFVALAGSREVGAYAKGFMAWFGPKGVATMTFALFVLGSQVPEAERIASLAALVVIVSIIAHGLTDHAGSELDGGARRAGPGGGGCGMIGRGTRAGRRAMDSWDIASLDVEPHHPAVLRSDGETRVIAINLPAGEELQEHQVHERAWLVVADGEVEIAQGGETVSGGVGFLAHFDPNERRHVRAKGDSRIVLLLSPWPGEGHPRRRDG